MEILKGCVDPPGNSTKGPGYEHGGRERSERRRERGEKGKTVEHMREQNGRAGGKRSAPFPPKKRRVKRWTLYK